MSYNKMIFYVVTIKT